MTDHLRALTPAPGPDTAAWRRLCQQAIGASITEGGAVYAIAREGSRWRRHAWFAVETLDLPGERVAPVIYAQQGLAYSTRSAHTAAQRYLTRQSARLQHASAHGGVRSARLSNALATLAVGGGVLAMSGLLAVAYGFMTGRSQPFVHGTHLFLLGLAVVAVSGAADELRRARR